MRFWSKSISPALKSPCPIVGGTVLPPIEIRSPHGFYDYDAKYVYQQGHTEYFCPVQSLAEPVVRRAMELSKKFYLGACCRDILRVDFIVTPGRHSVAARRQRHPGLQPRPVWFRNPPGRRASPSKR